MCQSIAWSTGTATVQAWKVYQCDFQVSVDRLVDGHCNGKQRLRAGISTGSVSVDRLVDGHCNPHRCRGRGVIADCVSRSLGRRALQRLRNPARTAHQSEVSVDRLVDGHCNVSEIPADWATLECQSIAWSTGTATTGSETMEPPLECVSRSLGRRALQPASDHHYNLAPPPCQSIAWSTGTATHWRFLQIARPVVCQSIAWSTGTATRRPPSIHRSSLGVSVDRLVDGHCNWPVLRHRWRLLMVSVDRLVDGHCNITISAAGNSGFNGVSRSLGRRALQPSVEVFGTMSISRCQSINWSTGTATATKRS